MENGNAVVTRYEILRSNSRDLEAVEIEDPTTGVSVRIFIPRDSGFWPHLPVDPSCAEACRAAVQLLERYLAGDR